MIVASIAGVAGEYECHRRTIGSAQRVALEVQQSILNVKNGSSWSVDRYVSGEPQVPTNQSISRQTRSAGQGFWAGPRGAAGPRRTMLGLLRIRTVAMACIR